MVISAQNAEEKTKALFLFELTILNQGVTDVIFRRFE